MQYEIDVRCAQCLQPVAHIHCDTADSDQEVMDTLREELQEVHRPYCRYYRTETDRPPA